MVWSKHEAWGGAYEITRRALKKHKDINVIFCHVDEAFEAVIRFWLTAAGFILVTHQITSCS